MPCSVILLVHGKVEVKEICKPDNVSEETTGV